MEAGAEVGTAPLQTLAADLSGDASPQQFMDSINAGNRQLGNRAFLHRVGQLHADKAAAPVQMQGKKDKRNKDNRPEEEGGLDLPALEAAPPALLNSGNPGVLDTVDSGMDIQQVESELESEISGAVDDISAIVSDFGDEADEPGAGDIPAGASSCNMQTFIARYFPVISSIYKLLTDRAGHVQTEDHGVFSLPGAGNALATVMLGILMVGFGLPPWTPARIASIIVRTIVNDIVYLLQFTIFPQISRRILQNRLGWGETRAGLFVSVLNNIFDVVSNYILSYLTNMPLAVFFVFQNLIDDNDMTPTEAAAAVIGYAAVGMLIQTASEAIFEHFVVSRVNGENLVPWLNQFRAIPNRLIRTISIALASFRNVIINVLSISLTTGQLSANIIGPLSTQFGQGGGMFLAACCFRSVWWNSPRF